MSFNRRHLSKRGGKVKNNFTENISVRRQNVDSHNVSYSQVHQNPNKSLNSDNVPCFSDFYNDPKTLYLLCKYYLGNFITIKTENEEFNGVLKAVSPNGDFCLTEATVFMNNNEYVNRNEKFKMIPIKDIKLVEVRNVDSPHNCTPLADCDKLPIDEEIAKRYRASGENDNDQPNEDGTNNIELTPFYDSSMPSDDCLSANKVGAHWFPPEEMFEKNKISFNVQSTYSESLEGYTTQLNKDDPEFEKEILIAQKKAEEIERTRDKHYDDLENGIVDESEEILFCSVSRSTDLSQKLQVVRDKLRDDGKSKVTVQINKITNVSTTNTAITTNYHDESLASDQKHNLNPNAREFTPVSSSPSQHHQYDMNTITMQMNSLNLQPFSGYSNIIQANLMPYSIPAAVMFPPHSTNQLPTVLHHNHGGGVGIEQIIIPRPTNIIPNYHIPPMFIPNQYAAMAFDPNLIASSPNIRCCDNGFHNITVPTPFSSSAATKTNNTDLFFINNNRENVAAESHDSNLTESGQTNDESKRNDIDSLNMSLSDTDGGGQFNCSVNDQQQQQQNFVDTEYQKLIAASTIMPSNSQSQKLYSQVVAGVSGTGQPPAFIVPTNLTPRGYSNIISNQISYGALTGYVPRQPSIVAPIHPVIANVLTNNSQLPPPPNVPNIQMKSFTTPNANGQSSYQLTNQPPPFLPIINQPTFPTIIPNYPSSVSAPIGAHVPIPAFQHHNISQFTPQFITTPIQPCNFFSPAMQQPSPAQSQPQI